MAEFGLENKTKRAEIFFILLLSKKVDSFYALIKD